LGDIYFGLGDFDNALQHFTGSLAIARELKQVQDEQGNYSNIAKVYSAKKDIKQAIDYFNRSKVLARQLKDSSSVAAIDAELIALQHNTGETTQAEDKLRTTLELFEQRGDMNRRATGFKNMADFYTVNKQFDKALEYTNKYYLAVDSIHSNELQLQVLKMEEGYNSVKKEKEIELLKKDQELQNQKLFRQRILFGAAAALLVISLLSIWLLFNRNRLRQRMKELELRNRIAADLHDEVGSSLSSINMLSQMAAQQDDRGSQKDILERMRNNARETMDKMGDIVWMIKPGETEAASLKQRMERFAYEICSAKNIGLSLRLDDLEKIKLSMDQRKNIYLVFKEALNNAVKYSGTERIAVSTGIQNRALVLEVRDEGEGFDTSLVQKGNGLDNIKNRAAELGGKLEIDSTSGEGTLVKLSMPVSG
jgi:signal transduction histidine kinase